MTLRVASVCSGVGGLDLGLHRAGHRTVSDGVAAPVAEWIGYGLADGA